MSATVTIPFTTNSNYTKSDSALIEASGNGTLILQDNASQTFTEDFADDTDFTYNATYAEFSGGKVQQKYLRKTNNTCGATYTSSIDLSFGDGVLTGSATGGAAIVSEQLDLTGYSGKYVDYAAASNAAFTNIGTVKFKLTPNWTGSPSSTQYFFSISNGSNVNGVAIYMTSGGSVYIVVRDSAGSVLIQQAAASWSPTAGVIYEFCLQVDISTGATKLYIDSAQQGGTIATTGTRTDTASLLRIGDTWSALGNANFYVEDLEIYDVIEACGAYTVYEGDYVGSKVELPAMTYAGVGAIQAFTSFATTDANSPQYVINDLYYNSGWVSSDGTWAQSSSEATILTNIATLPAADTVNIDTIFNTGNSQMDVDNLVLTYTGQIYPTSNPWIMFNTAFIGSELLDFVTSVVETGSDAVKFALEIDGSDYYVTGGVLTASTSYTQSNTTAEVLANKTLFLTVRSSFRIKTFLHSDDGSTTPTIDYITFQYNADLPDVSPTLIDIDGFFFSGDVGDEDRVIKYRPYGGMFRNEGISYTYDWRTAPTLVDSEGYATFDMPKNPVGTFWEIKFKGSYKITLEDVTATRVDFSTLTLLDV